MPRSLALQLTRELIRRPSVTPEDSGCQELIGRRLAEAGFEVEHMPFGAVSNLWARHGTGEPVLCFAGHTDVVPPGADSEWESDPFQPEERDGYLYGRGAADMKSSLAAMVEAAVQFTGSHPNHSGSLAFLLTSDEEGPARDGTLKVIEALRGRNEKIRWCVVGEPSCSDQLGDTIKIGRRGSLSGILTVRGIQGHVAYPQLARNPIEDFAPVLAELYEKTLDQGNEFFPPSRFQVVRIHSDAGAVNVTPGELVTRFNFRYSTEWHYRGLQEMLTEVLDRHALDYSLDWKLSGEPFLTRGGPLVAATQSSVRQVTGLDPELSTGGGTSDGRFISPSGSDVVEFGAVNRTIHKVNERILLPDVERMQRVYLGIIEQMLDLEQKAQD